MPSIDEYEIQAEKFLNRYGIGIQVEKTGKTKPCKAGKKYITE